MRLVRLESTEHGIFSELTDDAGQKFITAEHAYQQPDGSWKPKITNGTHKCVRGQHQLHNGPPFSTFEITGIAGHTNLLFHVGNYPQKDSDGCILVGLQRMQDMVAVSKLAFERFLKALNGINEFSLTVEGP